MLSAAPRQPFNQDATVVQSTDPLRKSQSTAA
jgi:hypothetical protein